MSENIQNINQRRGESFFFSRYTSPWGDRFSLEQGKTSKIREEEEKHGLDDDLYVLPLFMNTWEGIKAILWMMLWLGMEMYGAYRYAMNPEDGVTPGMLFLAGMVGITLYSFRIRSWYPLMRTTVDERKVRRFVRWQHGMMIFGMLMNFVLCLTPFWCFLFSHTLEAYHKLHGVGSHISSYSYKSNEWGMGAVTFFAIISFALLIWMLFDKISSEKSIQQRLVYLRYRTGEILQSDIQLINDIARKEEEIELKKKEIARLESEIRVMEKQQSKR